MGNRLPVGPCAARGEFRDPAARVTSTFVLDGDFGGYYGHDDLKTPFGKNAYLTDIGAPKDFTQFHFTGRERFEEVQRRIDSGYRKHRWVGLLAARHAEELYCRTKVAKKLSQLLDYELANRAVHLFATSCGGC